MWQECSDRSLAALCYHIAVLRFPIYLDFEMSQFHIQMIVLSKCVRLEIFLIGWIGCFQLIVCIVLFVQQWIATVC